MKRPAKQKRSRIPRGVSMTSTVRIPFRDVTEVQRTTSNGYEISTINLSIPNFASNSRVRTVAALYEYFRISKLKVKCISDTSAVNIFSGASNFLVGYSHGVGFIPSASSDFTTPTSYDGLLQLPEAKMAPSNHVLTLNVGAKNLYGATPTKWYHTATTGTPPTADSSAGTVVYVTRSSTAQGSLQTYSYVDLEGVVEFKAPLKSGSAVGLRHHTEEVKESLRINTESEYDFAYAENPRTGVRTANLPSSSSVPNTPTSNAGWHPRVPIAGENDGRSDRQLDRPRLVR
jgi:hypothetical protein